MSCHMSGSLGAYGAAEGGVTLHKATGLIVVPGFICHFWLCSSSLYVAGFSSLYVAGF